jgi:hypothetical protein
LAQRTCDTKAIVGTDKKPGLLQGVFAPPTSTRRHAGHGSGYPGRQFETRATQGNRERACSLPVSVDVAQQTRPWFAGQSMHGSGIKRKLKTKRQRYVTHDEYRDVYLVANAPSDCRWSDNNFFGSGESEDIVIIIGAFLEDKLYRICTSALLRPQRPASASRTPASTTSRCCTTASALRLADDRLNAHRRQLLFQKRSAATQPTRPSSKQNAD